LILDIDPSLIFDFLLRHHQARAKAQRLRRQREHLSLLALDFCGRMKAGGSVSFHVNHLSL
jgi:hypothetical protein